MKQRRNKATKLCICENCNFFHNLSSKCGLEVRVNESDDFIESRKLDGEMNYLVKTKKNIIELK